MANWVLAGDANALLIDTGENGARTYSSAVPINSVGGVLAISLMEAGVGLDQTNLIATFDGDDTTTGKSPVLRLRLAGSTLPTSGEQDFTFQWKLTMGADAIRDDGERQVSITDGLSVHVGPVTEGRILLFANEQTRKVKATNGAGQSFEPSQKFTSQDVIGQLSMKDGSVYLDVEIMSLISKLNSNADLLRTFNYTPENLLFDNFYGYNIELDGIPLVTPSGEMQKLSVNAYIRRDPNHAPSFVGLADSFEFNEDAQGVLTLNASDPESHLLSYTVLGTSAATVSARVEGNRITFTAAQNYNNTAGLALQLKVTDVYGAYNLQTLKLMVAPTDDAATLVADTARVREGRSLSGNVLLNDSDIDSVLAVASFFITDAPSVNSSTRFSAGETVDMAGVGSFSLNAQGDFVWQTQVGFSGALPLVHYLTPQGEESTLGVMAVPLSQSVGPSQVSGQVVFWNAPTSGPWAGKHSLVDGVQLSGLDELSTQVQSVTGPSGSYRLSGFQPASVLPLTVSKATTAAGALVADVKSAITLSDVLDALKIYLNKSVATTSSYKYVAADFDANGTVNLSDVLGILKTYLGKTSSAAPAWAFVDAQADVSGLGTGAGKARIDSALTHTFSDASVTSDTQNWVAVLRGDVNGSWASTTANMENMAHDQFLQLVGVHSGSL